MRVSADPLSLRVWPVRLSIDRRIQFSDFFSVLLQQERCQNICNFPSCGLPGFVTGNLCGAQCDVSFSQFVVFFLKADSTEG